ncbi:MAG TPA: UDP-N-acetylmuramoyl-L-alanyl-D-glutamate--2,6-diaminopimelate ligase [Blastocatellia bacterium]|nr:UDP-N-acetylmuramoyl-L-alanyl-D-glutamate--2,6-diaminopimelate ligase [Blastocatellia bacterium]
MKLSDLAKEVKAKAAAGPLDKVARDVTHDSRACSDGSVFVAIKGDKVDGHRFIRQALAQGSVAIISENSMRETVEGAAWIEVEDAREAMALAASAVHGFPSRQLKLVGVTGTNGKTTTAHLIDSIIRAGEGPSAIFGTISHRINDSVLPASHTTPEATDINRMLASAVREGCRSAVMEVSSHAIELRRANGLRFAVAVFTNLTRDHLDYHKTMENYFAAKKRLFDGSLGSYPLTSVINVDDEHGRRLIETTGGRVITYGFGERADVRTDGFELTARGLSFEAATPGGRVGIDSPLFGRPHVYNTLAAVATGLALGFGLEQIARGVAGCQSVAGRFEQVRLEESDRLGFAVIVDYAHTPDALENVLKTAREVAGGSGRVITVFGCGGDRDRTKRAPMGEIAARLSDLAIVTSDNPRGENPDAIIEEIEAGLRAAGRPYVKLPDRRDAIFHAVSAARERDVVVVAGKGHETYQILGDRTVHFDDREVAREAMMEAISTGRERVGLPR